MFYIFLNIYDHIDVGSLCSSKVRTFFWKGKKKEKESEVIGFNKALFASGNPSIIS